MNWNAELIKVAEYGDLEKVKECLANGADVNARDNYGITPLMASCSSNIFEIVKYLIENGASDSILFINYFGTTALDCAKSNEIMEYLEKIMQQAQANYLESMLQNSADSNERLSIAEWNEKLLNSAQNYDLVGICRCLKNGANMNARDKKGRTALMYISRTETSKLSSQLMLLELAKKMVEYGADVNVADNSGFTALMLASKCGFYKMAQYLLEKGANINAKDDIGETPLMFASFSGNFELVRFLTIRGANVNAKTNNGGSALDIALAKWHLKIATFLMARSGVTIFGGGIMSNETNEIAMELASYLTNDGIDIDDEPQIMSDKGILAIAKFQISTNANINEGLLRASQDGYFEVVKLLVENGADINFRYSQWTGTALDCAKTTEIREYLKSKIKG